MRDKDPNLFHWKFTKKKNHYRSVNLVMHLRALKAWDNRHVPSPLYAWIHACVYMSRALTLALVLSLCNSRWKIKLELVFLSSLPLGCIYARIFSFLIFVNDFGFPTMYRSFFLFFFFWSVSFYRITRYVTDDGLKMRIQFYKSVNILYLLNIIRANRLQKVSGHKERAVQ